MSDHRPVDEAYVRKMTAIMQAVDEFMNGDKKGHDREVGIVLLTFPFGGAPGRINYMANADRADMIKAMRELIGRMESDIQKNAEEPPKTGE